MLPPVFVLCLACNEAVMSKGRYTERRRGGRGGRLSDAGVGPTAPSVRLKLCCDSARLHCASLLYYDKKKPSFVVSHGCG